MVSMVCADGAAEKRGLFQNETAGRRLRSPGASAQTHISQPVHRASRTATLLLNLELERVGPDHDWGQSDCDIEQRIRREKSAIAHGRHSWGCASRARQRTVRETTEPATKTPRMEQQRPDN